MKINRLIYLAIVLTIFYYIFIKNILVTLSILVSLYVIFRIFKAYSRAKLIKTSGSKELFRKSELGLFIALVAKVAKADGRVDELEAQLIGIMFDDISSIFPNKDKTRTILKDIFNEEKERDDDTQEVAKSLNILIGRSKLKRKSYIEFLVQLAYIDNGISDQEDKVLRDIMSALDITTGEYEAILQQFKEKMKNQHQTMSAKEACVVLGVSEDAEMSVIKKEYRKLVRLYHPDIIKSQDKSDAYIEEATAKTQEINQAYEILKKAKK